MSRKIIIHYTDDVKPEEAIRVVYHVIAKGRISTGKHGPQFCYATVFQSGLCVYAPTLRRDSKSDTFKVFGETTQKEKE